MTWFKTVTFICLLVALSVAFAPGVRAEWSEDYPISQIDGEITCAEFYDGELYVGGYFSSINGKTLKSIAKWDGTQWTSVGTNGFTYQGSRAWVKELVVHDGKLYAGGLFDLFDGIYKKGIAMWDGVMWKDVGGGLDRIYPNLNPNVTSII
jgi:hypothetical protein